MKIGEAIEIKERKGDEFLQTDPDDIDEADRLSIAALRQLEGLRHLPYGSPLPLLRGETEE